VSRFNKPTDEELFRSAALGQGDTTATGIGDDNSFDAFEADAIRQFGSDWCTNYEQWCLDNLEPPHVPVRIHNRAPDSVYIPGSNPPKQPGPQCVRDNLAGLGLPPLKEWQREMLNECYPYEWVCASTATINKLKSTLPPIAPSS
jgi:hypothetical protein